MTVSRARATCKPSFDLSQPTISHHVKVLHEAGLVDREKRGVWVHYRVRAEAMEALRNLFSAPAGGAPSSLGGCRPRRSPARPHVQRAAPPPPGP